MGGLCLGFLPGPSARVAGNQCAVRLAAHPHRHPRLLHWKPLGTHLLPCMLPIHVLTRLPLDQATMGGLSLLWGLRRGVRCCCLHWA